MEAIIIAGCAVFAGALLAMLVYHVAFVTPALRRLDAVTLRLSSIEEAHTQLARGVERADRRLRELDALSGTNASRIGFVRYDAFEDTGSELSYALALIANAQGNGTASQS